VATSSVNLGALISGHRSSTRPIAAINAINGSNCDPAGRRTYRGGASAASALATVRRLIPSRPAIYRCDTPSLARVPISAHSNALTTSPSLLSSITTNEPESRLCRHRSGALFDS